MSNHGLSSGSSTGGRTRHHFCGERHHWRHPAQAESERVDELAALIEQQAIVIEELAQNNRNLALAVRNNRLLAAISIGIGVLAIGLAIWL